MSPLAAGSRGDGARGGARGARDARVWCKQNKHNRCWEGHKTPDTIHRHGPRAASRSYVHRHSRLAKLELVAHHPRRITNIQASSQTSLTAHYTFICASTSPAPEATRLPVMATLNFDINDALKHYMSDPSTIPTPEADGTLFDCENEPSALTNPVINPVLNPIIDAVAHDPDAILRPAHMDSLQFLLK